MAVLYPKSIIGIHRNWCFTPFLFSWKTYVGVYFPSLFFSSKEIERNYPLSDQFDFTILESGYVHLQATKPDTLGMYAYAPFLQFNIILQGVALRESPAGLAAYILEKFITWTNPEWKNLPDGGLTKKFIYDQLLDNIMIYWVTRSITTSMRIYAETFAKEYTSLQFDR